MGVTALWVPRALTPVAAVCATRDGYERDPDAAAGQS